MRKGAKREVAAGPAHVRVRTTRREREEGRREEEGRRGKEGRKGGGKEEGKE